jgi:hypothetical protein
VYVPYPVARPEKNEQKGHDAMDMHPLPTLLEAIDRICTYKKGKLESSEKSSNKGKKGKKRPGTNSTARVPKKVHLEKYCNLCKKHGGAYTMHNTRDCCRFERRNPISVPLRKAERKEIP